MLPIQAVACFFASVGAYLGSLRRSPLSGVERDFQKFSLGLLRVGDSTSMELRRERTPISQLRFSRTRAPSSLLNLLSKTNWSSFIPLNMLDFRAQSISTSLLSECSSCRATCTLQDA